MLTPFYLSATIRCHTHTKGVTPHNYRSSLHRSRNRLIKDPRLPHCGLHTFNKKVIPPDYFLRDDFFIIGYITKGRMYLSTSYMLAFKTNPPFVDCFLNIFVCIKKFAFPHILIDFYRAYRPCGLTRLIMKRWIGYRNCV